MKILTQRILTSSLILVLLLMVASQVAIASSGTTIDNVVVILDTPDESIFEGVNVLKQELNNVKVVFYGTFDYYWTTAFSRTLDYTLVGHGNQESVKISGQELAWEQAASVFSNLHPVNQINFLSCSSNELTKVNSDMKIGITFASQIDAIEGAYLISLVQKIQRNNVVKLDDTAISGMLDKLINRIVDIRFNPESSHFLILGPQEKLINYAIAFVLLIATIATAAAAVNGLQNGMQVMITAHPSAFFGAIEALHIGIALLEWGHVAGYLWDLWEEGIDSHMFDHIEDHMSLGDWLIFYGLAGFFLAIGFASGTALLVANVLLLTGSWINWANTYITDKNDADNTYGVTDGTVYNPPSPPPGGGGGDCGSALPGGPPKFCP